MITGDSAFTANDVARRLGMLNGSANSNNSTSYEGGGKLLSGARMDDIKARQIFARHADWEQGHYDEWIAACKGGPKAPSNFEIAGPVTEAVLLGNVAIRTGRRIEWDSKKLRVTNLPEANRLIRTEYRPGWVG
jgi:hypothetical protein